MAAGASLQVTFRDAARAIADVVRGRSLSMILDRAAEAAASGTPGEKLVTRAALLDLTHGTLRRYGRLPAITRLLAREPGMVDPLVEALLWCAIYVIDSERHAVYTVVDQAVHACAALERPAARGFVNAVLRRYLRERSQLQAQLAADPEFRWQHPRWWIDSVRAAWPAQWEDVLAAGNSHPPMCLRVNARRGEAAGYLERLAEAGIAARAAGGAAILLERPLPVDRLPGFHLGDVSVQDSGAQLAAPWLDVAAGMRVLDACAAPGGKCAHILELADVSLTAVDADVERCRRIEGTLSRLGLSAQVRHADCTDLHSWWDGRAYARILADVPCSASGVARRHPDIKWLRRRDDLAGFAARQARILDSLWRVLAPDGKLLYVTCSVFPEENSSVVDAFCQRTPSARRIPLPRGDVPQLLPGPEHDGFYFALLGRSA